MRRFKRAYDMLNRLDGERKKWWQKFWNDEAEPVVPEPTPKTLLQTLWGAVVAVLLLIVASIGGCLMRML